MKATDVLLLATLAVLVFMLTATQGSSPSELNQYSNENEADSERVATWVLNHLLDRRRDRRTQMDGGFLSRHNALQNFLNSYDADMEASDPHGPGRRK